MDMYRDAYAIAVMINGKVQKEVDNTVVMPFGTEYIVRLKNKQRKRTVADVHIDGRLAAKGIVVMPNGTIDLERFVEDGNLSNGQKFKFVPTNDGRVDQPNEVENGILEVRFYPEKDKPEVKIVEHHEYEHHYCHHFGNGHCRQCCWDWNCPICHPHIHWNHPYKGDIWCGTTLGNASGGTSYGASLSSKSMSAESNTPDAVDDNATLLRSLSSAQCNAQNVNSIPVGMAMNSMGEVGATVKGSQSNQSFTTVSIDVDYDHPVTLQLKLRGVKQIIDTCGCGFKRKSERFCPNCGTELAIGVAA